MQIDGEVEERTEAQQDKYSLCPYVDGFESRQRANAKDKDIDNEASQTCSKAEFRCEEVHAML